MMIENPNNNFMMVDEDLVVDCAGSTWSGRSVVCGDQVITGESVG